MILYTTIFKNHSKTGFWIRNVLFYTVHVWNVTRYLLFSIRLYLINYMLLVYNPFFAIFCNSFVYYKLYLKTKDPTDRAERHDFKSRFLLFILLFFFPLFRREEKRGKNNQSRDLSHAFLLNRSHQYGNHKP